jgi:hypothetical protein
MTRLSNLQFPMLQTFVGGEFMRIEQAMGFDQRPFRSMLIRKWVAYKPGRGFHITKDGSRAYHEFLNTDIARKNPLLPLTAYFDPTAYGLKEPLTARATARKKAQVHVIEHRRSNAA